MNLIDRAFLLKKNPIFNSLDMDILLAISDKTEIMIFKPGVKIFSIEEPSFSLYIIVEGYVKITDNSSSLSVTISSQECFGEESLFSNKPREYNAEAITQVRTLTLSRGQFLSIVEECPSVALSLLELYAKQITFRHPIS
ncbi:cyclic nucleotide-binding domain-containing protein [Chlamydia psittaci]|uniref:cyclic nucleotide-binding domain-containing protein n=1 Tax=Chlamydia psittaci TaxID=83554 RepID=UPI000C6D9F90|nr:cyclic nucleotide-binding domain-containing protein [Chlamydia psittaci]UMB83207.1 cAMP-dependent protein kinase regulatory chain [Chlamydia psittaci]UMB84201.1 cAMP-dependent protein kinase regulatory chain [Chlamydia psittaci]UZN73369.1 cAMP-dependent protein kinase regulatory chain [Chlamydia psittaci]